MGLFKTKEDELKEALAKIGVEAKTSANNLEEAVKKKEWLKPPKRQEVDWVIELKDLVCEGDLYIIELYDIGKLIRIESTGGIFEPGDNVMDIVAWYKNEIPEFWYNF